jgi:glucose-6-phosphate isomerase
MEPACMVDPTTLHSQLIAHAASLKEQSLQSLFDSDPQRVATLILEAAGLVLDVSKQRIDQRALELMIARFEALEVDFAINEMFSGALINRTEGRAVLHTALRDHNSVGDAETKSAIAQSQRASDTLANQIRSAERTGATGRPLRAIVHIGIGGSDLGPRLMADALRYFRDPRMTLRFVANVDPADINDALHGLDPETTLVVMVSKSFGTQETLLNANVAREWLASALGPEAAGKHMVAVSANTEAARAYGIAPEAILGFGDYIGGRFSLWSAVSFSLSVAFGPEVMARLRAGAAMLDHHFRSAPPSQNIVWLKAITDIWNRNYLGYSTRAVVPYAKALALLPQYLQQLEMESNGKSCKADGTALDMRTAAVVWGAEGSNAQHAFFQHLHQSPDVTPVDLIGVMKDRENNPHSTQVLQANMLAQAQALMLGQQDSMDRHRHFSGDRPSTLLFVEDLDPEALGALIALHEHKVYLEALYWGINAFDQFGVELGKQLAKHTLSSLQSEDEATGAHHDPSTQWHLGRLRSARGSA